MVCFRLIPYVEGSQFTVPTIHEALMGILNLMVTTGMLARWFLHLQEGNINIVPRVGVKNRTAGTLLCLETTLGDMFFLDEDVPVVPIVMFVTTST